MRCRGLIEMEFLNPQIREAVMKDLKEIIKQRYETLGEAKYLGFFGKIRGY